MMGNHATWDEWKRHLDEEEPRWAYHNYCERCGETWWKENGERHGIEQCIAHLREMFESEP